MSLLASFKKVIYRLFLVGLVLLVALVSWVIYYFNFVVTGPRSETPFALAHERAVRTFVEGKGLGIHRFREKEYFHERSVVLEGEIWDVERRMNLIGASREYGERYFVGSRVPLKKRVGVAEHRLLDDEEAAAIAELRKGEVSYVILRVENQATLDRDFIRVVAPVLAEESCLKCHDSEVGVVLGAFDYLLSRREEVMEEVMEGEIDPVE